VSRRYSSFQQHGVDYIAAVPCSFLKRFLAACEQSSEGVYVPAVREDHAAASCAGAWLAGKKPLAAMQNSGLGYCLEVLASLHLLYEIPLPMVVSDRGDESDFEEHQDLGGRARSLLELFDIPWREATEDVDEDSRWLLGTAEERSRPAVLLVRQEAEL
jgi:phosphonopyruvate decarboxylase